MEITRVVLGFFYAAHSCLVRPLAQQKLLINVMTAMVRTV